MSLIVQKFGGTSVANPERIKHVASIVKKEVDLGNQVAVVVSAMSGFTNTLVGYANDISSLNSEEAWAEYDTVVSSGEQITAGLLAMALQELGVPAQSWLGLRLPVKTNEVHTKARIESIDSSEILSHLKKGEVVVVPGFQGVNTENNRVTTLGRGGSDTSAVALAAGLKADRCDIFTDVDGVYTTDPRLVPKARKLHKVGYEEMLEMASLGAKVLQTRSVELGMKYNVPVMVRSSFEDVPGTLLTNEEEVVERRLITGVTYSKNDAQFTLIKVSNVPGVAAKVFGPLADANINVDMIVQNVSEDGNETDITFTVPKEECERAKAALNTAKETSELTFKGILVRDDVAKVSVIGVGMRSHAGLAQKMFATLADKGINILVISTSEIKVSTLIEDEYLELALRSLHTAYGLDSDENE